MLNGLYARAKRIYGDSRSVEKRTKIARSQLKQLADGKLDGWTTTMVERLARVALVDAASVWAGVAVAKGPTLKFLRSGSWPDFQRRDLKTLMLALSRANSLRTVARTLNKSTLTYPAMAVGGLIAHEQAYGLGAKVRADLGNPTEPMPNMYELLGRNFAIYVHVARLRTARVEAAAIKDAGGHAVLLNLAQERRPAMLRRAMAHELCHALFDPLERTVQTAIDSSESVSPTGEKDPLEQRARAFAAELLVPKNGLLKHFGYPKAISDTRTGLKLAGDVVALYLAPPELVANHLANHGYLHQRSREYFVKEARSHIELPTSDDQPVNLLQELIDEAVERSLISYGRGVELVMEDV